MVFFGAALLALQEGEALPRDANDARRPAVEPTIAWWRPALDGRVRLDEDLDDTGAELSLSDDLSLDEPEGLPFLELTVSGTDDTSGAPRAVRALGFLHEWSASEEVVSRLRLGYMGMDVLIGVPRLPDGLSVGALVGWRFFRESLEVETPQGTLDDKAGGCGVGLGLWTSWRPVDGLRLSGQCSAYGAYGAPVAEARVAAGVEWGRATVDLGYRSVWIEGELYDAVRLTLRGPTLGLTLAF